eukprot:1673149-Pleurochrysis_carterae.AAC.2
MTLMLLGALMPSQAVCAERCAACVLDVGLREMSGSRDELRASGGHAARSAHASASIPCMLPRSCPL